MAGVRAVLSAMLLAAGVLGASPVTSSASNASLENHFGNSATFPLTTTKEHDVALRITSFGDPTLGPDTDLRVTVEITNSSRQELEIPHLVLRSQSQVAFTHARIYGWMSGTTPGVVLSEHPVDLTVKPGETITHTITVDSEDIPWSHDEFGWGARGIEVGAFNNLTDLLVDRSMIIATTDADITPMPLSIIAPVTVDPDGLGTTPSFIEVLSAAHPQVTDDTDATPSPAVTDPDESTEATGAPSISDTEDPAGSPQASQSPSSTDNTETEQRALTDESVKRGTGDAVMDWNVEGVSLFFDPSLLEDETAIAELANDPAADLYITPLYDADIAALAHADDEVRAQKLVDDSRIRAEELGIEASPEVLLPAGILDSETVDFASNLGISTFVVPEEQVPLLETVNFRPHGYTEIETVDETQPAIVTNDAMSAALGGRLTGNESIELDALDARQVTLALSSAHFRERPNDSRAVILQIERGALPAVSESEKAMHSVATALLDAPWIDPVGLTGITRTEPVAVRRASLPANVANDGEISSGELDDIDQALSDFHTFALIFDDPDSLVNLAQTRADELTAIAWRTLPHERSRQIEGITPSSNLFDTIRVESSSTINMISESSALPIHVTNSFDYPVNVLIELETPDTRLQALEPVEARLPAQSTSAVSIPVEAWGSGNLRVTVQVTNSDGVPIGASEDFHVRVRADWETVGTVIFAGFFGLLLVVGVFKSVKKGRRSDPIDPDDFSAAINARKNS